MRALGRHQGSKTDRTPTTHPIPPWPMCFTEERGCTRVTLCQWGGKLSGPREGARVREGGEGVHACQVPVVLCGEGPWGHREEQHTA